MTGDEPGDGSGAGLPEYARKQPWYFTTGDNSLAHQRLPASSHSSPRDPLSKKRSNVDVVEWKPGSCTNCGSRDHKAPDCPERPRKRNARVTGVGTTTRGAEQRHNASYAEKHDHFANYDSRRWHREVSGQFRLAERTRASATQGVRTIDIQEQRGHTHFRDRQDIAGYLNGRDTSDNWMKASAPADPTEEVAVDIRKTQAFAERKAVLERTMMSALEPVKESPPLSKYGDLEDVVVGEHSEVFGSFFSDGRWGYACCHQLGRDSPCTRVGNVI